MRFIFIVLFLCACATANKATRAGSISYEKVRSFAIGSATENDVISSLGPANSRADAKTYYTLNYDDPKTGLQRLSLNFQHEGRKLSGVLWIPNENEKEASLVYAKAAFKGAHFKEKVSNENNPHMLSQDIVSYIDEKSGVTIRYDQEQDIVEAIAMYDTNVRLPAEETKKENIPYRFSDDPAITK